MPANISVMGVATEAGMLKESQATFRKHHAEVGAALLNVSGIGTATGLPVDKDDARPGYVHQPYPMMVYHAQHGELIVEDAKELDEARRQGYRDEPYAKPQIAVNDPATEKKALQLQLQEKDGQIASLADQMQQLLEWKKQMEAARYDESKKKAK